MYINNQAGGLKQQIQNEITQYLTEVVNVGEAYDYSQYKLIRRISLFANHTYPTGKIDSQGNYKFWFDGIKSRIDNEVKNVDFDTKDIQIASDRQTAPQKDDLPVLITNLKLKDYLRETGQADEINSAIEEGSGWGNIVWKKIKGGYERVDLKNFYVINQTAETLCDTPVIERHQFTHADLRKKIGTWDNVEEVIKDLKQNIYKSEIQTTEKVTTVPYYDIYERNGEISVKDLKETNGETPVAGDEDKYVFAKVIAAAKKGSQAGVSIEFILFAEEMKGKDNDDLYVEFHRSAYRGRWWREGMYELLLDDQVRLNQIGNQLAQGLEFASKLVLQSKDKLIIQNILGDLKNGDIIKGDGLAQVDMIFHGFSQLTEEWNRVQQHMNDVANSSPIVTGEGMPQRMPFQVAALLNQNANKLFDYIRQKLAIPYTIMFEEWIVPELVQSLKTKDFIRLTGDPAILDRIYKMIVNDWYLNNLVAIGPHDDALKQTLIEGELNKLKARPELLMTGIKAVFKDFTPSVSIDITGENSTLPQDLQTLAQFIQLEEDPIRRSAMIELAMAKKGIDVASLPKAPPQQQAPQQGQGQAQGQAMQSTAQPDPTKQPLPKRQPTRRATAPVVA